MSKDKDKKENVEFPIEESKKEAESEMTAMDFASAKRMGKYYEEQFRMIFGEQKKTANKWKEHLLKTKLVSAKKLN